MMRRIAATLLCASLATSACAQDSGTLAGPWQNESGSVMFVETTEDGRLSGRYCSELGRTDPGSCHPLTGWITGDVVGFAVRFDPPGSVTAWSGQIGKDESGPFLRTLWHLSRDVPDAEEGDRLWESVVSGFATFRPIGEDDAASLEG